jgi:hypothetical protein
MDDGRWGYKVYAKGRRGLSCVMGDRQRLLRFHWKPDFFAMTLPLLGTGHVGTRIFLYMAKLMARRFI